MAACVGAVLALLLTGCAAGPEPDAIPTERSETQVQKDPETQTIEGIVTSWEEACLLDPAVLNPILARSTSEPNVQIGEPRDGTDSSEFSSCEYTPRGVEWAYPAVELREYGPGTYGVLVRHQGPGSDLSWTAEDRESAYATACTAATASASNFGTVAECLPDVAQGAVFGATEAVVFLDDATFAVISVFGVSADDQIMPELLRTMIDQVSTSW